MKHRLSKPAKYLLMFFKWAALGVLTGCIGGVIGALFHHGLHALTGVRLQLPWLVWLLPAGGIATVGLYRLLRLKDNRGTNEIIAAVLERQPVKAWIAPAMLVSTSITHLLGGSAGREGAALQIGGSVASSMARVLHLKDGDRTVLVMSGMSAVFAGLFGTPLTATVFTMEFESVGTMFTPALLPCFVSAFVASIVAGKLGVHPETAAITAMDLSFHGAWRIVALAAGIALLGIAMCFVFHKLEHWSAKWIKNSFLRIAIGGVLIAAATTLVGDHRYNGAGMDMALQAVAGACEWYDFLLKLLFTAVTLAAGFKGGEIVPTFCIGATFGCFVGSALGLDPGFAAALGLVGLFCSVTNSPIASILLAFEMFGGTNLHLFALVCVICFVLSGRSGLYARQILEFSKTETAVKK